MLKAGRFLPAIVICLAALAVAPATADALEGVGARPLGAAAAPTPNSPSNGNSFDLAVRYEHGEGVAQDYGRALSLYCEAAEQNDARAFQNLGWMFLNGRGVGRDAAIAVGWFHRAADGGVEQAANLLRSLASVAPTPANGC